ncbi:MAG: hypothetical protein GY772_22790, partial [bacterium]|nr:hypothetical protein [bacterium]
MPLYRRRRRVHARLSEAATVSLDAVRDHLTGLLDGVTFASEVDAAR